jgi:hypothetical protein
MGSRAPGPLRWGAIAIGVAVDVGGTQLCTTAISMLVGIRATIRQPQATLDPVSTQAALHITMSGGRLYALLTVVGLLCSVAGGYLTAYVARTKVLLNAAVMGMCSGIVGLLMASASSRSSLSWSFFALTATTIPAAALGGLLCHLARQRD